MKGIDKKACRAFLSPARKLDQNNGILHAEQIEFIVCTAIHNVGHRRLLILDFYSREQAARGIFQPVFTMFQASDAYITYDHRDGVKTKWRSAALENLDRNTYHFDNKCAFYSRTDEERVLRFCAVPSAYRSDNGFVELCRKQNKLLQEKSEKKKLRREERIVQRMKPLRPMGKQFDTWIKHDLLPQYIFYQYHRTKKPIPGQCTACGQTVEITGPAHNKAGVCPACGVPITFKCTGRQKRIWDRTCAQMIQRISEQELVIRVFKAHRLYLSGNCDCSISESARIFLRIDGTGGYKEEWFYNAYVKGKLTSWKRGLRPRFSYYRENFEAEVSGHLFTRKLEKVLAGTPWEYSQIGTFYLAFREMMEVLPYLTAYLKQPFVEYMVKLRLYNLAAYIVYHNNRGYYSSSENHVNLEGKSFQSVLGVGKEYLPLMQALNISNRQLGLLQGMLRLGLHPNYELLEWCGKYGVKKTRDLLVPLSYTTAHKFMRYATEQYEANKRPEHSFYHRGYYDLTSTLEDYRDYLCMCEGLQYNMKSSFVLFPRNLKEAHDRVMELSDTEKSEVYERQIQQANPLVKALYQYEKDGWMIVAPKTAKEITDEGISLHHCVDRYIKRVAMKECVILFLRKASEPDKPFGTIELVDDDVAQARGFDNRALPDNAEKFLAKWKQQVLYNPRRKALASQSLPQIEENMAA